MTKEAEIFAKAMCEKDARIASLEAACAEAEKALDACVDGFEFTRQYVGYENLPAIKGWTWFDANELAGRVATKLRAIRQGEK